MCVEANEVITFRLTFFVLIALSQSVGAQADLTPYQEKCESIGFKPKSEKFADCVMELFSRRPSGSLPPGAGSGPEESLCLQAGFKQSTRDFLACQVQLRQLAIQQQQFVVQQRAYDQQLEAIRKQQNYDQAEALFGIANQALGIVSGGHSHSGHVPATRPLPPSPLAPLRIVSPSGNTITCSYQGPTLVCR